MPEPAAPRREADVECARGVAASRVLAALEAHERASGEAVLAASARGKTTRVPWDAASAAVVKETRRRAGFAGKLEALVRPSRAARAFRASLALAASGVETASALACVEQGERSFFISRHVEGERLDAALARRDEAPALAVLAAKLAARIHAAGVAHGDLKPQNLVLSGKNLVVLDLDAARVGSPSLRARAKDLAALDAYFEVLARLGARERHAAFLAYTGPSAFAGGSASIDAGGRALLLAVLRRSRWKRARWRERDAS